MNFKEQVHQQFIQLISEKIAMLKTAIADLRNSSANETKSSAGDKYETARAMLQIDINQLSKQLQEAQTQKAIFDKIDIYTDSKQVIAGSLVKTNKGYLFLSIAAGKIIVSGETVFALSPQSPLGLKLLGLKVNDKASINNTIYQIEQIV